MLYKGSILFGNFQIKVFISNHCRNFILYVREPFTFEEFLGNKFSARRFSGTWWSNTELLVKDDEGNLVTWNVTDQTSKF